MAKEIIFAQDLKEPTMSESSIEHLGRVDEVTRNDIRVTIISKSACAACHAQKACSVADTSEKTIVISKPSVNFIVGESVKVIMKESLGFKALAYGYLVPVLILIVSIVVFTLVGISEINSGILSILMLVPYFVLLRVFRQKIEKQFSFSIEKIG